MVVSLAAIVLVVVAALVAIAVATLVLSPLFDTITLAAGPRGGGSGTRARADRTGPN